MRKKIQQISFQNLITEWILEIAMFKKELHNVDFR